MAVFLRHVNGRFVWCCSVAGISDILKFVNDIFDAVVGGVVCILLARA